MASEKRLLYTKLRTMKYLKLLRVHQWVKNSFLFIPLFFAGNFFDPEKLGRLALGFLAFSLAASTIYILNDYFDRQADRLHPEKRTRPLASGTISPTQAFVLLGAAIALSLGLSWWLSLKFFFLVLLYVALNSAYSFGLKHIPILDMLLLSAGFVIRVKAGGALTSIYVSEWLTIMIFLLAMFLAVAKRRDDLVIKLASGTDLRKSVKNYNLEFINACLIMLSGVILVAYLTYTISDEVTARLGTHRIYYTCVFVIAGIMRYMQLALVENNTGSPTKLLFKDRFIQASIFFWVLSFYFILYLPALRDLLFGE